MIIFLLGFVNLVRCQYEYEEPLLYDTFPDDFFFGVATSAFQVKCDIANISFLREFKYDVRIRTEGGGCPKS